MQFRFWFAFTGAEWRLAIALTIAAAAAAAAPAAPTSFAGFAFAQGTAFLARLRLTEACFLGRTRIMILVRDRVLWNGLVGELLTDLARFTRLTATSPAATSPPAPASRLAFAIDLAARLAFG